MLSIRGAIMAGNARYDEDRIDYGAVYFSIMPDEAIRPAFDTKGAVKVDADGVPVIAESLTLVKIGTFREPTGKVDRPVFQADQIHAYDTGELAKFRKATKAVDVATVLNGKPAVAPARVAGF